MRPPPAKQQRRPRRWVSRLLWGVLVVVLCPICWCRSTASSTLMSWRWATGARVEGGFVPIDRMVSVLPVTVIASVRSFGTRESDKL